MAEENNIANYTAADIEKYWKGKLSPAEMHAMEKAAMDDPFFADALEGYQYANAAGDDLKGLAGKINERAGTAAKVIPITTKQKKFNWLRIAAAIIIIGGAGILVQQIFFTKKTAAPIVDSGNGAKQQAEKSADVVTNISPSLSDTVKQLTQKGDTLKVTLQANANTAITSNLSAILDTSRSPNGSYFQSDQLADIKKSTDDMLANTSPALAKKENKEGEKKLSAVAVTEKPIFGDVATDSIMIADKNSNRWTKTKKVESANAAVGYDRERNSLGLDMGFTNKYNYKVVDAQNNPVPFANVMNTRDNVGTYTDIRGNFNLVSSDSIMDVQIRSQGYVSNNYRLMPSTQPGALVLKEDDVARRQITVPNRPMVTSVTRKDSAEIEEPEVGWGNYNTYVQNNIQIPENIRGKKTSADVELSFDIDKNGQPVNIKVTKSSQCKECDEEAKRLLKEGPKWKRKGKKSKTTISIAIDQ